MTTQGPVCCDTSFLFSLYGNDVHSPEALRFVNRLSRALAISNLNDYELGNAFRFAEWRGVLERGKAAAYLADYAADISMGKMVLINCNLASVIAEAKRISEIRTLTGGHRSFDILHVATARHLNAEEFLSFDDNQRTLAKMEGLKVLPR